MGRKMTETEMLLRFDRALKNGDIFPCYQPQFNHSTGRIVGAEALMRWNDPELGMQSPADFIPVFENYRLIHKADLYMVKCICRFLRNCLDKGLVAVPISFNISRFDFYSNDFVSEIETIRKKYKIPVELLRAEITESSSIGGMEPVTELLSRLHDCGYLVEMDDFGTGYSSLNALKDMPVDIIKLDMRFLSGDLSGRGGTIISSVVQLAKWLCATTIAEGVETRDQADFMLSIGCKYIQGYYYSKPLREEDFIALAENKGAEATVLSEEKRGVADVRKFLDPGSVESVLFSRYAGPAAVFNYDLDTGAVSILRVNSKYLHELGMNLSEEEIIYSDPWKNHDADSHKLLDESIKRAIETGEEVVCESWRTIHSSCCGEDEICVRNTFYAIGRTGRNAVVYSMVRNITAEKSRLRSISDSATFFGYLTDQINAYAWEYDIDTKKMHPCARCRRDLGLPEVVENYPEPVIESGLFPADYADMYREWHRRIAGGEKYIEGVIPLTEARIPFRVRYTTVFDESGRPLKAFGSATFVEPPKVEN